MSYIGNTPTSIAFLTDLFTGTGSLSVFTMSAAPASTSSILVSITGVVQEPSTYSVSGNTLTFSQAPPAGTGNISIRYLGIPASGVVSTAYRTVTEFTATLAQTIFTVPSYTVGYITVYRNGVRLGTADYTATSGTNVILGTAANTGDLITTESFYVSSVLNAIPAVAGAITSSYILDGAVGTAEIASGVTLSSPNTSGNLNFSGTAQRITGDFSNITTTSVAFQSSVTNGATQLAVIANGTSTNAGINFYSNSADITNSSRGLIRIDTAGPDFKIDSQKTGTGTYLPITFHTSGSEKLRLDTSGNLLVGTTSASVPSTTGFVSSANTFGFKNRIINGGMVIDQRNAGASVTPTNGQYLVDRWEAITGGVASKYSVQQNAGAVTLPVGFTNYLGVTSLSAYSVTSTDRFNIAQPIEGYNFADLAWGTASASTVTLSFKVYSSLTGTFGGSLQNNAQNRSYPFIYSIPVANTWTTISITITGDTTGTWLTTNSIGVSVYFSLGSGSTYQGTAGAWAGADYRSATGAVSVVGTSGATFYITGVQLEKGSVATSFDQRAYSQELAMCQRYYQGDILTAVGGGATPLAINRLFYCAVNFPVPFRATPTMTIINTITSINMNAGEWTQLDALRGYFQATNSVTNDCVLTAKSSGAAEL